MSSCWDSGIETGCISVLPFCFTPFKAVAVTERGNPGRELKPFSMLWEDSQKSQSRKSKMFVSKTTGKTKTAREFLQLLGVLTSREKNGSKSTAVKLGS